MSAAISATAYSSGVTISARGMPITVAASTHNAESRQVARRLRRCASRKLSRLRGRNRCSVAGECAASLMGRILVTGRRDARLFRYHSGLAHILEVPVATPGESHGGPFFRIMRIGVKASLPPSVILHHQFGPVPSPIQIEITPM